LSKIHEFIDVLKEGLCEHQKKCYPAVKWLLSEGYRASSRTRLMAMVYIEEAVRNPGVTIHPRDHSPAVRGDLDLLDTIRALIEGADVQEEPEKRIVSMFEFSNGGFRYVGGPVLRTKEPFEVFHDFLVD
jgi:hypothetical protein